MVNQRVMKILGAANEFVQDRQKNEVKAPRWIQGVSKSNLRKSCEVRKP